MLNLRYRDWTAVRLQNASSVAYLNELFAAGWYLMDLDLGELKCLAFSVPMGPPTRDERRMIVVRQSERTPSIVVVIVSRGRMQRRQVAVYQPDGGPMSGLPPGGAEYWEKFDMLPVEEGGIVTVYQRRPVASGGVDDDDED